MKESQLPKNEFVREQIKNKPKNKKRLCVKLGVSALCGLVFALAACGVVLLMLPIIQRQWKPAEEVKETQGTEYEPVTQTTEEPVSTEEQTVVEVPKEMTLGDYQRLQNELYAIGTKANKSIVSITSVVSDTDWFNNSYEREGQGSGAIIDETTDAYLILTERKVIKDASKISVTFIDDASAPAELIRYDGNTGIAILSVKKADLEDDTRKNIAVIGMGSSNTVHKGTIVIALGSPLGTNYSILTGNITATSNEISTWDSNYSVFTTDIVASRSGSGILINVDGELVGVVMQDYSTASTNTLTALAVSELRPVIDILFEDQPVPYLGLHVSTVTDKIAETYDLPKGVYIKEVAMDSPAMNAGLQSGDVIIAIAGTDVATDGAYSTAVMGLREEETYPVVIMRQGSDGYKKLTCEVEPGVLQ